MKKLPAEATNTQGLEPLSKSEISGLYDKIKCNYVISYEISERPEIRLLKRKIRAGVPKKYIFAEMPTLHDSIRKQLDGFEIGKSYYIWGGIGTGKTHLVCALVNSHLAKLQEKGKLNDHNLPVIASVPEILLHIKQSFQEHSKVSEQGIIYQYSQYPCLIMDDMGTEKPSEWVMQTLYSIVDTRYKDEKQTLFTSNLSLDKISDRVGDRIPSRIAEMCEIVQIKGVDRRINK